MVCSPLMAARATFALKAGEWFLRGRFAMLDLLNAGIMIPMSGSQSTYSAVQIFGATSQSRITDSLVPLVDRQLAGDQG